MADQEVGKLIYTVEIKDGKAEVKLESISDALKDVKKSSKKTEGGLKGLWKQFAIGSLAASALTRGLRAVWGGLKDFVGGVLQAGGQFEQTRVAFETMLGSAEKGQRLLKELSDFAVVTPFTITGIEQNAKQLLAMGIEVDKLLPTLEVLGNASSALNQPLARLALNYGQVKTQAKLTGRELRDFAVIGVDLVGELAKMLKVSEKAIFSMTSAGEIGFPLVEQAFINMSAAGGIYFDLMKKQAKTLPGLISNLEDSWTRFIRESGEDVVEPFKNIVIDLIKTLEDNTGRLAATLKKAFGTLAEVSRDFIDGFIDFVEGGGIESMITGLEKLAVAAGKLAQALVFVVDNLASAAVGLEKLLLINDREERLAEQITKERIASLDMLIEKQKEGIRLVEEQIKVQTGAVKKVLELDKDVRESTQGLFEQEKRIEEQSRKIREEEDALVRLSFWEEMRLLEESLEARQEELNEKNRMRREFEDTLSESNKKILQDERDRINITAQLGEEELNNRLELLDQLKVENEDVRNEILNTSQNVNRQIVSNAVQSRMAEVRAQISSLNQQISAANAFKSQIFNLFSTPIIQDIVMNVISGFKKLSKPFLNLAGSIEFGGFGEGISKTFNDVSSNIKTGFQNALSKSNQELSALEKTAKSLEEKTANMAGNIGGGGGGGGKKGATEESKELKEQMEKVEDRVDAINKSYEDFNKKIEDSDKNIEGFKEKIQDLEKELLDLNEAFQIGITEETEDFVTNLAERRVDLEERAKEIQKEITDLKKEASEATEEDKNSLERITELQNELKDIQDEQQDIQKVNQELADMRAKTEKKLLETTDEDEKALLERRLEALDTEAKFREEQEERQKSQTELEFEEFLRKLDQRQQEFEAEKELIQLRIDEQQKFLDAELENQRVIRFAWQLTSQTIFDLNKKVIDDLNLEYQGLITTIKNAITESNKLKSAQGFAGGGFTGEGGLLEPAGVVHKNEYVAPSWMVKGLPNLFKGLEDVRTGETTNNKTVNLNYKASIGNRQDLTSEFNRLAWLIR